MHLFKSSNEEFVDADIKHLPFENSYADTIILTQVLEHIDEPYQALDEVYRVLKKNGILILSVPFIYQAHGVPYDFHRFSEYALRNIAKQYNFKIIEFHYQGFLGTTIISIINGFIWELFSKVKLLRNTIFLPFILIFFALNNLIGILLDVIKLKNFTPNFFIVLKKE